MLKLVETNRQLSRKMTSLIEFMDKLSTDLKSEFSFTSEICNVSKVEALVESVFAENNVSRDHYARVLIALTEAVNNAILHGNSADPCKMVCVSFQPESDMLYFYVKDEGKGFDPECLPDPTDPEYIDKPNGRGVFLMKKLADTIEFVSCGNKVKLGFKVNA